MVMQKLIEWQELLFQNPVFFGMFIVSMWILALFTIARITGWSRLAEQYRTWAPPETNVMRAVRAYWANVMITGNIYTLACNRQGLYLAVLFPFRFGHPPLLIPWNEIKTRRIKGFLSRRVQLEFGNKLSRPFEIFENTAEKIKQCSKGKFDY